MSIFNLCRKQQKERTKIECELEGQIYEKQHKLNILKSIVNNETDSDHFLVCQFPICVKITCINKTPVYSDHTSWSQLRQVALHYK
jgi:hypothetical protein